MNDDCAGAGKRWVCHCCGRYTEIGARRYTLRDSSCVLWAVLCLAERNADGEWVAAPRYKESAA